VTIAEGVVAACWAATIVNIGVARRRGFMSGVARMAWVSAASYGTAALFLALGRDWPAAGGDAALAAFWLWLWWRGRRGKRRKALKAIGDKSRAVLAAMARNMPRPAPRLAPQSA